MIIVYHCYGGTHSSVLAAALHTGLISPWRPPGAARLFALPFLDRQDGSNHGQLYFFGTDEKGHHVYVLGRRRDGEMLSLVFGGPAGEEPAGDLLLVNAMYCVPPLLKIGGFLSRRLKLTRIGRPLVVAGLRQAYPCLRELVYRVKAEVDES